MSYKILLLCFALGGGVAFAQNGELGGLVADAQTGEPLLFANISLEQEGDIIVQTIADENGKYLISSLQEGIYTLKVSFVGYEVHTFDNIRVNNKELTVYNLDLKSGELPVVYVFPDIIIETPLLGEEIDIKEIKQIGARDAGEIAAQSVPQVYSQDGGEGGGLYISGARADATLYVVDGIRVIGSAYVPKSAIANITVYTGGIPANYGDVTGGIIEITTRGFAGN